MRRILSVFALLMILSMAAACSASPSVEQPSPTPLPTAVKPTFTVARGDIVVQTTMGGRVVPVSSKPATFAVDGTIGTVYVQEGDHVDEGQLLADLDVIKDLETQWAKTSAEANYEETVSNNTIKRAEIKLQIAQLNLQALKAQGASQPEIQIADLQTQLAQMDLDEIKANPALHAAAAKVKELEQALADAQLKAPIAGYIVGMSNPGQTVRKTSPSFQIGDITKLEVGAAAREDDLKQLAEGMPVTVTLSGGADQKVAGTIRQLPYPYGSGPGGGDMRITVSVSPEQGGYKLGDLLTITVVLQQQNNVLWLPPQAIRNIGGRTFVLIQSDKGPQRVEVTLGVQILDRVEITAGLTEGQAVVGP
jgi:membrane fusion protein, macrolide-specific efflux system